MQPNNETFVSSHLGHVSFISHVDPSRLNMASKQITQAVISDQMDIPYVVSKDYPYFTRQPDIFRKYAEADGIIIYNNFNIIILAYPDLNWKLEIFRVPKYFNTLYNSIPLKYITNAVNIKKGDLIYTYAGIDLDYQIPTLGYRAKIAYMPFFGYNVEDAFIISQSFAKKANISYNKKELIPISSKLKYYKTDAGYFDFDNQIVCRFDKLDIVNGFFGELENLQQIPSTFFSNTIEIPTNYKIHKLRIHKINEPKTNLYMYNPGLLTEIENYIKQQPDIKSDLISKLSHIYKDPTNLVDGIISTYFQAKTFKSNQLKDILLEYDIDSADIDYIIEIEYAATIASQIGDKFTNAYAGKGICSLILPDHLMPYDSNGPCDIIFNYAGISARNNWGVIFEQAFSAICEQIKTNIDNREFVLSILRILLPFFEKHDYKYYYEMKEFVDNLNNDELYERFAADVKTRGMFFYINSFDGIAYEELNSLIKEFQTIGVNIQELKCKIPRGTIDFLKQRGYKFTFEYTQDIAINAFIGYNYFMKLFHTSESKYNVCDISSGYKRSTGQPVKGRKYGSGGTHFGWQSTAALFGHDVPNIIKELFTIKSDSLLAKKHFIMQFSKHGDYRLKNKYLSVTKRIIGSALASIGLNLKDR